MKKLLLLFGIIFMFSVFIDQVRADHRETNREDLVSVKYFQHTKKDGSQLVGGTISIKLPYTLYMPRKLLAALPKKIDQHDFVLHLLDLSKNDFPAEIVGLGGDWEGRNVIFTFHADKDNLEKIAEIFRRQITSDEITSWKRRIKPFVLPPEEKKGQSHYYPERSVSVETKTVSGTEYTHIKIAFPGNLRLPYSVFQASGYRTIKEAIIFILKSLGVVQGETLACAEKFHSLAIPNDGSGVTLIFKGHKSDLTDFIDNLRWRVKFFDGI